MPLPYRPSQNDSIGLLEDTWLNSPRGRTA
jgi:hypothetical protein